MGLRFEKLLHRHKHNTLTHSYILFMKKISLIILTLNVCECCMKENVEKKQQQAIITTITTNGNNKNSH